MKLWGETSKGLCSPNFWYRSEHLVHQKTGSVWDLSFFTVMSTLSKDFLRLNNSCFLSHLALFRYFASQTRQDLAFLETENSIQCRLNENRPKTHFSCAQIICPASPNETEIFVLSFLSRSKWREEYSDTDSAQDAVKFMKPVICFEVFSWRVLKYSRDVQVFLRH